MYLRIYRFNKKGHSEKRRLWQFVEIVFLFQLIFNWVLLVCSSSDLNVQESKFSWININAVDIDILFVSLKRELKDTKPGAGGTGPCIKLKQNWKLRLIRLQWHGLTGSPVNVCTPSGHRKLAPYPSISCKCLISCSEEYCKNPLEWPYELVWIEEAEHPSFTLSSG